MLLCGHRNHRVAGLAALLLTLALPTVASAAENAYVSSSTLTYSSSSFDADHVTVADGGTSHPGQYVVSETNTPSVLAGAGCTDLSLGQAACAGPISTITVNATGGADRVTIDVVIAATVYGGTEDDVLTGGGRGDWIFGNAGNDTLYGRGGGDWLDGGDGNDIIEARDGGGDVVICGSGIDTAYVDPDEGTSGCETVISDLSPSPVYTPPSAVAPVQDEPLPGPDDEQPVSRDADPAGGDDIVEAAPDGDDDGVTDAFDPDTVPTLSGPVQLTSAVVAVSKQGVASFELACAATETAGCRGKVFLDPAKGKAKGKRGKGKKAKAARVLAMMARRGRFGRSSFVIAAGKRKKLAIKLSTSARKALGLPSGRKARAARRGRGVRARVVVVQRGRRAQKTIVTLRG